MKLAVTFPGVGYHTDKPLLYYAKKTARELGYDIAEAPYGNFEKDIKGSAGKMEKAFFSAKSQAEHIYYTPVGASFQFMMPWEEQNGIVFHGKADSWAETADIEEDCRKRHLPLYTVDQADHSLETGDVFRDIENLLKIMEQTKTFLKREGAIRKV